MKIAFCENNGNEVPFLETAVHIEATDWLCENTEKPGYKMGSKSSQWFQCLLGTVVRKLALRLVFCRMDILQNLRNATAAWCWPGFLWPLLIHTEDDIGPADHRSVSLSIQLWPFGPPKVPQWRPLPLRKLLTVEWPGPWQVWRATTYFLVLLDFIVFCPKTQKYSVII